MSTAAPRVLLVGYGGGHMSMLLPVISALERLHPGIDCQLMALTIGHRKAAAIRPCLGYRDFWSLVDEPRARAWGERLLGGNDSPDVPREETIAYLGINYLELIDDLGEQGASEHYRSTGRRGFRPKRFMKRVVESMSPNVVVATNSPRSEQAALEVAATIGIPTLGMVDLYGLATDPFVARRVKPTITCVLSPSVRGRLVSHGFDGESVRVTGNPAFDSLFAESTRHAAARFLERRGWQDLHGILWAGHSEPDGLTYPRKVEQVLVDYVQSRNDLCLVIRYHPSDWFKYPRPAEHPRIHFSETSREPPHPLVVAMDTVVVQTSTVGLEGAIAGKHVIALADSHYASSAFDLADLGVATRCQSADRLPETLDRILDRSNSAAPGTRACEYASDGLAAERVAGEVLALAGLAPLRSP